MPTVDNPAAESADRVTPLDLSTLTLARGNHKQSDGEMCVMEAVAYVAGEPWSDHPACASPILTGFCISLNDQWDTATRQRLVPFVPRIVGTRDDGKDELRGYLALDWLIRTYTPAWLDLAGLTVEAQALRDLRRIVDLAAAKSADPIVRDAREKSAAAVDAAVDAAWDAAWDAAGDAAGDAAVDAAWDAAWDAARDAAWDAAWDAARDAVRAAAGAAAGDAARAAARAAVRAAVRAAAGAAAGAAARAKLAPTVDTLQTSALDLLDRMIDGRWEA